MNVKFLLNDLEVFKLNIIDIVDLRLTLPLEYQETRKKELEQDLVAYKFAQKFLGELGENLIDTTDIEAKIAELLLNNINRS